MAILDWEGFDRETANLGIFSDFWGEITADGQGAWSYGRALYRSTQQSARAGRYSSFPTTATLHFQCHFWCSAFSDEARMGLLDGSSWQIFVRVQSDGVPRIVRGDGTILASASNALQLNTWHFVQLRVTIANAGGSAELRIDGQTVATLASGDTQNTATAGANGWKVEHTGDGLNNRFDNVIVHDTVGDAPTSWTPETRIYETLPTGAGFTTEWTPTGAAANWQCVDEQPSDGDTTYVSAATAPLSDLYTAPAEAAAGGIVYGVAVHATVRKDDAGASEVDGLVRTGAATFAKGSPKALTTSYVRQRWLWTLNPATGLAWTLADANAAEVGIRRST